MDSIESVYSSELKMENLCCKTAELQVDYDLEPTEKMGMEIEFQRKLSEDKSSVKVELSTTVESANKHIVAKVVLLADFILAGDYTQEFRENIFEQNTLAIMFPFIRSQMAILTTQPGVTSIILPPINTKKFSEDKTELGD